MNLTLSARDRRALAGGAATLCLIVAWSRLAPLAFAWRDDARRTAASLTSDLSNQETSVRSLRSTRDSLVPRQVRLLALDSAIIEGDTPALAGASLAELLSNASEDAGVQLSTVQVRTDSSAKGAFVVVAVQASVNGTLAAVADFLSQLESGTKLLTVRQVTLGQSGQSATPEQAEMLRAEVVVEGLARNRAPNAKNTER